MQRRKSAMPRLLVTLLWLGGLFSACAAEDDLIMGRQAYIQKNYSAARDCLLKYVQAHPDSYQGHYMLGNCYVQLSETEKAKLSYELALASKPDRLTEERCLKVIEQLVRNSIPKQKPTTGTISTGNSLVEEREPKSVDDLHIKALENDILSLEKNSREEVARIKAECKEAEDSFTYANGNWRRNIDTGERNWGVTEAMLQGVRAPFDARIEEVRKTANDRIAGKRKEIDDLKKGMPQSK